MRCLQEMCFANIACPQILYQEIHSGLLKIVTSPRV